MKQFFYSAIICFICLTAKQVSACERIVSIAPSLTESVSAIGLADKLIGIGRYDTVAEGSRAVRVGGLLDPNLELIVSLKPDLVLILEEQQQIEQKLTKLGLRVLKFDHRGVAGIIDSLQILGQFCNKARALNLAAELKQTLQYYKDKTKTYKPVSALVLIGNSGSRELSSLYVSGSDGFYTDLLKLAGAENCYKSKTGSVAGLSREGLLALDPEIILIISSPTDRNALHKEAIIQDLTNLSTLRAVQRKRIYFLQESYAYIPGPSFVKLLERFYQILHAEPA